MDRLTGASIAALVMIGAAIPITSYAVDDKPSNAVHQTGKDRADEASAAGRAHAKAMKAWAKCVADHAGSDHQKKMRPKDACGPKPVPPGRAKHGLGPAGPDGAHKGHGKGHEKHGHEAEED